MRAQLYLDDQIRKMLKEPFETFAKTYVERVIPIFSSLEENRAGARHQVIKLLKKNLSWFV